MPPTTIHSAPPLDSFTLLADHQSQTPEVFYGAKPVLHYHAASARALTSRDHVSKLPIFSEGPDGEAASEDQNSLIAEVIDAYINSENLTLFNTASSTGISIPYPSISLHAIQTLDDPANNSQQVRGLYMQLELSDPYGVSEDEEPEVLELTLIPATSGDVQQLFEAVSNCSNLHPDPTQDDDDMEDADGNSRIVFEGNVGYDGISGLPGVQQGATDGGLPPPFPGSGGWITAENVSEYFDEEGNWIGERNDITLGEGAGRVRTRDETEANGVNGNEKHESDDNKRPRTD